MSIIGGANLMGIIIIGGFIGLTAWALTGFRIGEQKKVDAELKPSSGNSHHTKSLSKDTDQQDISTLSPKDIGRVLAISLDESCKVEQISKQEQELLVEGGISLPRYQMENTILAGFAQKHAIQTLLENTNIQKEVLGGYMEVWATMAKSGTAGEELYQLFIQRCPYYEEALKENELFYQQHAKVAEEGAIPVFISRIAFNFGEFLAINNAHAHLLALACADAIYKSHFEGAALIFKRSKLI